MISFAELIQQSRFLPFAHRGASKLAPENTFAAFQAAYDLGFKIVETDIRASRDGVAYCFHDLDLMRMTGDSRKIEEITSQEVDQVRIKGTHPIPKLQDLYEAFPDACFNLDAKSWSSVDPLVELVRRMDVEQRTCFGSFSQARLDTISQKLPSGAPAQSIGTKGAVALYLNYLLRRRLRMRAVCVQLPVKKYGVRLINRNTVDFYHSLGLKAHVWTVNDATEMQHLIDIGVDGIMTDDCELLKSVLKKNHLWEGS